MENNNEFKQHKNNMKKIIEFLSHRLCIQDILILKLVMWLRRTL